jgi:alpha-L-fucosidase
LTLASAQAVTTIDLREDIALGQRVAAHVVEAMVGGAWREVARGTTIGYRRLFEIPATTATQLRVRITETVESALPVQVLAYAPAG